MADDFPYEYRYLGSSPKVFSGRSKSGEQLINPGESFSSDAPMHHGELEPISQQARDFAAANGLALEQHGGELWANQFAAANGMAYEVDSASGKVAWKKASKAKATPDASDVTSAAAPASSAPQEA